MIVAPTTANVLAKTAAGIADDALTTTISSCIARKPVLFAPAMNDKMWENPATQQAINTIRTWPNVRVIEPDCGPLACGTSGKGRMPEIEVLQEALEYALTPQTMRNQRVLITAGGTQEKIDPVRFISNYSTGKMGVALAHACARRGAQVTLVCGAVCAPVYNPFSTIRRIDALSAQAMYEVCCAEWPKNNCAILCAAVADFTPTEVASQKMKKEQLLSSNTLTLSLKETPDIARALGESKKEGQILVGFALETEHEGFALETEHEKENALHKLERKHLDAIVLNSLRDKGAGFGTDTNIVTILQSDGSVTALPLQTKAAISEEILKVLFS